MVSTRKQCRRLSRKGCLKSPGYQEEWSAGYASVQMKRMEYQLVQGQTHTGFMKFHGVFTRQLYSSPKMAWMTPEMSPSPRGCTTPSRVNFYKNYLIELKKAIDEGANVS